MVTGQFPIPNFPLNAELLELREEEANFLKILTGIQSEGELEKHIIDIATKAYKTRNYPCIRGYRFTRLETSRSPAYQRALCLLQKYPDAIFLDAACCFGQLLRKAVFDGWPVENAIAFDLDPVLWNYGHELFKSTPMSFPAGFVRGDAFDPNTIQPRKPFYGSPPTSRPRNLLPLKSLIPLQGHINAIHTSMFFHLFSEETQTELAKHLASLLSPAPGSIIFGGQRGSPVPIAASDLGGCPMFCHSPESWQDLWDGHVFEKGTVRVDAVIEDASGWDVLDDGGRMRWLVWSVTRL